MLERTSTNNVYINTLNNVYYYLHNNGFLFNLHTGYILSPKNNKNLISISSKKYKIDNLIYCHYKKIPFNNKLNIIHSDNNLLNNNINNLKKSKIIGKPVFNNKHKYMPISFIILYKQYNLQLNKIEVFTNLKFIRELFTDSDRMSFALELFEKNRIIKSNSIWEIELITINTNKINNYIRIPNTNYRISKDNTHIINVKQDILLYNLNDKYKQYINIPDLNNKYLTIYYIYNEKFSNYFNNFNNFISDSVNNIISLDNVFYNEIENKKNIFIEFNFIEPQYILDFNYYNNKDYKLIMDI